MGEAGDASSRPRQFRSASRVPELLPIQTRFQKLETVLTTPTLTILSKNAYSTLFISHRPILSRSKEILFKEIFLKMHLFPENKFTKCIFISSISIVALYSP